MEENILELTRFLGIWLSGHPSAWRVACFVLVAACGSAVWITFRRLGGVSARIAAVQSRNRLSCLGFNLLIVAISAALAFSISNLWGFSVTVLTAIFLAFILFVHYPFISAFRKKTRERQSEDRALQLLRAQLRERLQRLNRPIALKKDEGFERL